MQLRHLDANTLHELLAVAGEEEGIRTNGTERGLQDVPRRLAGGHPTRATIAPITRYCRRHGLQEVPDPYYGGPDGFEQVLDLLWQAPLDQAKLAGMMGVSVATLRRRLAEEGHSYRGLLSHVRQQQTLAALKAEVGLEDLAEGLGYSEARSLRRATRRWFGASPSALRGPRR